MYMYMYMYIYIGLTRVGEQIECTIWVYISSCEHRRLSTHLREWVGGGRGPRVGLGLTRGGGGGGGLCLP